MSIEKLCEALRAPEVRIDFGPSFLTSPQGPTGILTSVQECAAIYIRKNGKWAKADLPLIFPEHNESRAQLLSLLADVLR